MWVLHVRVIKLLQHTVQNTGIRAILSFWRHPFTAENPMDLNFSKSVLLRYDGRSYCVFHNCILLDVSFFEFQITADLLRVAAS